MADKLDLESKDLIAEKLEQLQKLFPNLVTEGENGKVLDLDQLKNEFSTEVVEGTKERYRLEWPGKKEAIVTANLPTTKTLRPVKEDSVDFDNTENLYIEGDNLEVLKVLQESYFGKIKMIYIDPPYNTGKDFVYKDNFSKDTQEELEESGQKDEYNQRLFQNADTSGRYHSDWLSMMYPRLKLARNLLTLDGVIFISIDDNEIHNLRKVCDSVFGGDNFICTYIHKNNSSKNQAHLVSSTTSYFLSYAKDKELVQKNELWRLPKKGTQDIVSLYEKMKKRGSSLEEIHDSVRELFSRPKYSHLSRWNKIDGIGIFKDADLSREGGPKDYTIINPETGLECVIPNRGWGKSHQELLRLQREDLIWYGDPSTPPGMKDYITTEDKSVPDSFWYYDNSVDTRWIRSTFGELIFDNPKPIEMIKSMINMLGEDNITILDFFSGSATTAHAVLELNSESDNTNLRCISIQLDVDLAIELEGKTVAEKKITKSAIKFLKSINKPTTLSEIGKERIRRAGAKIKEETGADIDYGFRVYRLDESNMADIYHTPQDYDQDTLELFADNVKEDRNADDLLAQIMLDWGLPLSLPIEEASISGKRVFKVAGNSLLACFDTEIDEDFAKKIAKEEPLRIVFKDAGFASDTAKSNVKQLLKQLSPETEMKVI